MLSDPHDLSAPRLYVGVMNDGVFIIDQPPRPVPVDCINPDAMPTVNVIAALKSDFVLAERLVSAWNGALDA